MMESVRRVCSRLAALGACLAALGGTACRAEQSPAPQYINLAPLPGAGLALNPAGRPDGQGAMQINIPVAYTPGDGFINLGAYSGQFEGRRSDPAWNNGTGVLGLGFGTTHRLYASVMAVSSCLFSDSKAVSVQFQLAEESEGAPALSIGAQDLLDKEHDDFSEDHQTGVGYYAVATRGFALGDRQVYGTLGYGFGRFLNRPFGGVCAPLSDQFSLSAEYDGFQVNAGLGWRPGGRLSNTTILAAYNGKAGPLVGIQTAGRANGWWAVPIALVLLRE